MLRVFTDENEPGPEPPSWVSLFSVLCICYQFNILINLEFTFPGHMGNHPLYSPWKKIFSTLHPTISKKFSPVLWLSYALIVSESLYLILRAVISKQKYNDDRSASNSLPKRSTLREIKVIAYWSWVEKRLWTIECRPDSSLHKRLSPYFMFSCVAVVSLKASPISNFWRRKANEWSKSLFVCHSDQFLPLIDMEKRDGW